MAGVSITSDRSHNLRHLLAVRLRVERRLSQQDRVLLRRDPQLVVESVVPDLQDINWRESEVKNQVGEAATNLK